MVSFLDLSRWVAATIVFVGHLRNPLFLGFNEVEPQDRTAFVKAWYFITGLHAEAVVVFFVLSGLLVAGVGVSRIQASRFNSVDYAIDRFSRLYVAFIPALLICYICDCIGSDAFSETGFWNGTHPVLAKKTAFAPFESLLSLQTLLLNCVMLQHFWVSPLGSNQPLWTISTEFWFYVAFGMAAVAATAKFKVKLVALALLALLFFFLGPRFLIYLGCWLVGMAIVFIPRIGKTGMIMAFLVFAATLLSARMAYSVFESSMLLREMKNYTVAITFAFLVASLRGKTISIFARFARLNRFFADFSYSLYLLHFPVMLLLLAGLHGAFHFSGIAEGYSPTSYEGRIVYVGVIVAVYVIAWGFSRLTEAKTANVRRYLKSFFQKVEVANVH